MFLPIRSKNPPESFPGVTCALIAINCAVFLATSDGGKIHADVLNRFGEKSSNLSPLTLISSMFLHGSPMHLIGNMWFLYLFGFAVEGRLRSLRFAALYFGSGVAGSVLHHFMLGRFFPDMPSIGASGAIMGVVGAALYIFPFAKILFFYYWSWMWVGLTEIPMWGVAAMYVDLDVVFAFFAGGGDGVGHFAHIGGAVGGVAICMLFRPRRDSQEASLAKACFAETGDIRALTRIDLAELHRANPEDTTVLLNWMVMCLEDNKMTDECTSAFIAALPRIAAEQPILSVASCISLLGIASAAIDPSVYIDVAMKVEASGNPSAALQLYDQALRDSRITSEDEECALYRSALIFEVKLLNESAAVNWYEELIRRYPMSTRSSQAGARLARMRAPI